MRVNLIVCWLLALVTGPSATWDLKAAFNNLQDRNVQDVLKQVQAGVAVDWRTLWDRVNGDNDLPNVQADTTVPTYSTVNTGGLMVTWSQAKELCVKQGRILPLIKTQAELDAITKFTALSDVWLDMTDVGTNSWRWSDGSAVNVNAWDAGEPNYIGTEKCGRLHRNGAVYNFRSSKCGDNGVDKVAFAVCGPKMQVAVNPVVAPVAAPTYSTVNTGDQMVTWSQAKELCAKQGRMLPTIKSTTELDAITKFTALSDVWLAMTDVGTNTWRWSDGSAVSVNAWDAGEPNNIGTEKCGRLHRNGAVYNFRSSKCGDNGVDKVAFAVCGPKIDVAVNPVVAPVAAQTLTFQLECASWNFAFRECKPAEGVVLSSVAVKQQQSNTACKLGDTFGIKEDGRSMWVSKGCRAVFTLRGNTAAGVAAPVQTSSTSITQGECKMMDGSSVDYAKCSATGDPHYTSFDGRSYDFQGSCCYTMVKLCADGGDLPEFEVQVCNDYNGRDPATATVTWTRTVTVIFQGATYVMGRNNLFQVDGVDTFAPYTANGVSVTKEGCNNRFSYVLRAVDLCNKIIWDGAQNVQIYLNKKYAGLVCGLCGNMNGQTSDDLFPFNGKVAVSTSEFGNSFMVPDRTQMNAKCAMTVPPQTCDEAKKLAAQNNKYCGYLNHDNNLSPFYVALNAGQSVDGKTFLRTQYINCLEDRCMEPGTLDSQREDICQVLENINDEIIADTGKTPTSEWRIATGCALNCAADLNTVQRNDAKLCQNSCVDPTAEDDCADTATFPGCRCKTGMVRDLNGKCVDVNTCDQCLNVEMQPGNPDTPVQTLIGGQEAVLEPCVRKVKCTKSVAQYIDLPRCHLDANCVDNKCVCRQGYNGDGFDCIRESAACKTDWISSGAKCFKFIERTMPWEQATRTCCSMGAQMARVDSRNDLVDLINFMRSSADRDYWIAGDTQIVKLGTRVNSLPTSYDPPRFVNMGATVQQGCYYARGNGNVNVHINCQMAMPAICEYANPSLDPESTTAVTFEYRVPEKWRRYTHEEAVKMCASQGEDWELVAPKSAEEMQNLKTIMSAQSPKMTQSRLNLLFSGTGSVFNWGNGGNTATGYTSWYRKDNWIEPNNMAKARSVIYDMNRDGWNTEAENQRGWGAVCQKTTNNANKVQASKYMPINTGGQKVTWYKAKELCAKEGRVLPMVKTQADLDEITKITTLSEVWLGLRDVGTNEWRWTDGSSIYLNKWDNGEPNNVAVEKCGRLFRNGAVYNLRSSKCGDNEADKWGFVVCGPRGKDMPHVWSPYIAISDATKRNIDQVMEIQKNKAIAAGRAPFACGSPLAVECQAQDSAGEYQSATKLNPKVLCNAEAVQCQENSALKCANFRVRLFCPNEENLCQSLAEVGSQPCMGNQVCIPESGGCFTCQCPAGHTQDANGNCHQPCGHCSLWGDPHYTTFSGSQYDFQGKCLYLLNGICDAVTDGQLPAGVLRYSVLTKNDPCGVREGVTCLKRIVIKLYNAPTCAGKKDFIVEYVSGAPDFWVNGQKLTQPYNVLGAGGQELISIGLVSRVFKFKAIGGLYIEAANGHEIRVVPPAVLRDEMCGICGQCTDNYRLRNGTILSIAKSGSKLDSTQVLTLGNSWIESDPLSTDGACEVLTEVAPPCSGTRKQVAVDACKVILDVNGPFKPCHGRINPQNTYSECEFDVCLDETKDRCEIMSAYVSVCKQQGIALDNWRSAQLCPMTCPDKMEYSQDISCQKVCGEMTPDCSNTVPMEGCRCKQGYYYMAGQCVTESECGCKVILTGGFAEISLKPGEEVLDIGCGRKVKCIAGGRTEVRLYTRDPNSICVHDEPPTLECARGYTMSASGDKCDRNIDQCAEKFMDVARSCINVEERPRIWRRALEKCNELNATLMQIDIPDKFNSLKEFMLHKGLVSAFVSGQVRVFRNGDIRPILTDAQKELIQYNNFVVSDFAFKQGIRTDDISLDKLPDTGAVYAVAVVMTIGGDLIFKAVSRAAQLNFVCEERPDRPGDYTPTGFCSGSEPWNVNGEYERASELVMIDGCEICLYPTSVKCERVDAAGRADGQCGYNNGMLYKCDGADCADMKVSGMCPKDVNECKEGLHDCPPNSDCVNNNGAYSCRCRLAFPLMIENECKALEMCSMVGTSEPLTFDLHLMPFTADEYGSINYDCAMSFARTCRDLPDGVPGIDIMVNNVRDADMADQSVTVSVSRGREVTNFDISSELRRNGQLMVNNQNRVAPMSFGETEVVAQANDGTVVVQDRSQRFRVIITPGPRGELALLKLELSSDYSNKMCGLCTLGAAGQGNRFVLTEEQLVDVNRGGARGCVPMTTPRATTTTPTIMTTMFITSSHHWHDHTWHDHTWHDHTLFTMPPPPTTLTQTTRQITHGDTFSHDFTTPSPTTMRSTTRIWSDRTVTRRTTSETPRISTDRTVRWTTPSTTRRHFYTPEWTEHTKIWRTATTPHWTERRTTTPHWTERRTTTPQWTERRTTTPHWTERRTTTPVWTDDSTVKDSTRPHTEDPCASQRIMCQRLGEYCEVEESECVRESCMEDGGSPCTYLGRAALNFCRRDAMAPLMSLFSEYCTETCAANMQVLRLARVGVNPSCAEPRPDLVGENAVVDVKFQCMCDYEGRGEVQENGRCVARSECGCRMGDDYRHAGEIWSAKDCSSTFECRDGEVVETPRNCDENSVCVNRNGEMVCECTEGFKGDGNMPDGCKIGEVEKEKTCYEMRPGEKVCYCNAGYAPTCDGCKDINECAINRGLCDKDKERCENTDGSYKCMCRDGYRLDVTGACVDENECLRTDNPCPANSQCINLPGRYSCRCCAGYDSTTSGTCVRNEQRVPDAWIDASRTASGQPLCCTSCPYPQCINPVNGPSNGCYKNTDGTFKSYVEFRFVYEELCLKRIDATFPGSWTYGDCPTGVPMVTEAPVSTPATDRPRGRPTGRGCNKDKMCSRHVIPPQFYNNNQVCGPLNDPNKQTYPSFCAMLIALCNLHGGSDNYSPPKDIFAEAGACTSTTPPPTTTALISRLPPVFGEWGPWSGCVPVVANLNCGAGVIVRSRHLSFESPADSRQPLPSEMYQADGCFLGPCPVRPGEPEQPKCPPFSICSPAREPICGQIGFENPKTYSSQCVFELLACERDEPKQILYSGDCQKQDSNPRLYCEQAPKKVPVELTDPTDSFCKAIAVDLASCGDRLCHDAALSSNACCVPEEEEMIEVTYVCDSGTIKQGAVLSPLSCRCEDPSQGANDMT